MLVPPTALMFAMYSRALAMVSALLTRGLSENAAIESE
jgi:hypothetical protein